MLRQGIAYFVDVLENFEALDSSEWKQTLPFILLEKSSSPLPTDDIKPSPEAAVK